MRLIVIDLPVQPGPVKRTFKLRLARSTAASCSSVNGVSSEESATATADEATTSDGCTGKCHGTQKQKSVMTQKHRKLQTGRD